MRFPGDDEGNVFFFFPDRGLHPGSSEYKAGVLRTFNTLCYSTLSWRGGAWRRAHLALMVFQFSCDVIYRTSR